MYDIGTEKKAKRTIEELNELNEQNKNANKKLKTQNLKSKDFISTNRLLTLSPTTRQKVQLSETNFTPIQADDNESKLLPFSIDHKTTKCDNRPYSISSRLTLNHQFAKSKDNQEIISRPDSSESSNLVIATDRTEDEKSISAILPDSMFEQAFSLIKSKVIHHRDFNSKLTNLKQFFDLINSENSILYILRKLQSSEFIRYRCCQLLNNDSNHPEYI
jgi:hypothetical protein